MRPLSRRPPPSRRAAAAPRSTASDAETRALGAGLGARLRAGDLIVLTGPLGAGKTCFVAGLAEGAGCGARVRSPSFTLINEYEGPMTFFHLDLYRLEGHDAEGLGLEERCEQGAMVAEWGEKLPAHVRADALTLTFTVASEHERTITAGADGGRGAELLAAWEAIAGAGARA
ncbi:MAG: tRNA (adenosine(37)-N6)-threonylcarbamoyltransferase complex ATPase subunit type 1 TsaE [Candidatus Eisenbacteria bacterium]|uniref:tRNA threonylcarbamoyladenosine biosynthesis protein TsaE n=1 Tax=Eiseniibacteriota bacterium TaxID=2212470 RepID=A0A9D6L552_UNCEI|nr:tRNA (adenosine(37)-N6)-threonylcarbamoyltransferase complex ATPase subunit type 1 TsaE [Candidatus Eisenbacteria bacterium]MBI3539053.1 tRNA (adenosine(37)-N6)-threonylcarbamoyltransferase complex ATPase subunit type 1 TsaE [Candidatus Eisenbacteria bacterium]